ncbi:MAG: DUF4282 domain-containing protein [Thermoplasmatota archaeon]
MANQRNFKNYFSFRWLITPGIIRVIHVIGIIVLNLLLLGGFVGSIILVVMGSSAIDLEGGYLALGIVVIILGGIVSFFLVNIGWRMICEQAILFFSLHEITASVENELKDVNSNLVKILDKTGPASSSNIESEEDDDEDKEDEEEDEG